MTCTVGLTLKPGESCHYAGGNDYFNFDFIFYVRPNGVGFTEVTLKTPSHTYNAPAAVRYGGSVTYSFSNELTLEINDTVAQICAGQNRSSSSHKVIQGSAVITWEG